jgi:hypothetical protein
MVESGAAERTCRLKLVSTASESRQADSRIIVGTTWIVWISKPVMAQPSGWRPNASSRKTLLGPVLGLLPPDAK